MVDKSFGKSLYSSDYDGEKVSHSCIQIYVYPVTGYSVLLSTELWGVVQPCNQRRSQSWKETQDNWLPEVHPLPARQ